MVLHILFLAHPFLLFSLFFPTFSSKISQGQLGVDVKREKGSKELLALLSSQDAHTGILGVAFGDKDTNPALQKWIIHHLKTVLSNYRYVFGLQRLQRWHSMKERWKTDLIHRLEKSMKSLPAILMEQISSRFHVLVCEWCYSKILTCIFS